jgi:2-dehydropantoate 2-reductase
MTVHVLGLGSIGLLSAHILQKRFQCLPICFLPRPATRPPTVYTLHDVDGKPHPIGLANDANGSLPIEFLLITTKAHHTREAIMPYIRRLRKTTLVAFVQNGMGVIDSIRDILPSTRIVLGTTTHAAYRSPPDQVHWVFNGETLFAPLESTVLARHETSILSSLGQVIEFSALERRLYRKLALNACINPVTAIYKVLNGEVARENSPAHLVAMRLAAEIQALYSMVLPDVNVSKLSGDVRKLALDTGANTSSMLADILAGRTTEVDFINGYMVKMGQMAGINVIQNELIVRRVKELTQ